MIKFVIVLVVAALSYSVFWFFKMGQVEKQINKFISENGSNISAGEISVSGFPLMQKVVIKDLKFTIPNALLDKRQVIIKNLEAKAGIFSSDFAVALVEQVSVQDIDGSVANVEFSKEPEIMISFSDGRISKFSYNDFGYRIFDAEKNVIYAAANSNVVIDSAVLEDEKISTKISVVARDIEGFGVIDAYKNALEKKIIDGLKTGEIAIGNATTALIPPQIQNEQVQNSSSVATPKVETPAQAVQAQQTDGQQNITSQNQAQNQETPAATTAENAEVPATIADNSIVKSNFTLDVEYVLTPNKSEQQVPFDPTQIQEIPLQYAKLVKINNLDFSNPLYKIVINGEMNVLADDNLPSGGLSIKVEKIDNLVSQLTTGFTQMAEKDKTVVSAITDVQSSDLASAGNISDDSYQVFLSRISANLSVIAKELAAKNPVSKEDVAQFDVRREKNLDFLINETTIREVLGKF
ncbi:MAG: hypothetical protein A2794_05345 [Alphaproteobacteria bacterium RIFCSPHIGHO2_01_FULL_40_8]|nr:MAG: hypothetical protein A2794_05345 [Alphaproteobacteria bacterium RIFCSPHIGHO2_01_FULL_40_8]